MISSIERFYRPYLVRYIGQSLLSVGGVLPGMLRSFRLFIPRQVKVLRKAETPLKKQKLSLLASWDRYLVQYFGSSRLRSISLLCLIGVVVCQGEEKQSLSLESKKELNKRIMFLFKRLGERADVVRERYDSYLCEYFFGKGFVPKCLDIFGLNMSLVITESKGLRREEQNEVVSLLTRAESVEEVKRILSNVKDPALFLCLKNSCESCLSEEGSQKKGIVADITCIFCSQVLELEYLCDEIKTVQDLDHFSVHSKEEDEEFLISLVQKSILHYLFLKKPPENLYLVCESRQPEFWTVAIQHVNSLKEQYPLHHVPPVILTILTHNLHLSLRTEILERALIEREAVAADCLRMVEENQEIEKCSKQLAIFGEKTDILLEIVEEFKMFLGQEVRRFLTKEEKGTLRFEDGLVELFQETEGEQRTISDVSQRNASLVKGLQRGCLKLILRTQEGLTVLCCEGILAYFRLRHVGQLLDLWRRLSKEWP